MTHHNDDDVVRHVARDAGTGEFVTAEYAAEHPETTVTETVRPRKATKAQIDAALRAYAAGIMTPKRDHEDALEDAINAALGLDE